MSNLAHRSQKKVGFRKARDLLFWEEKQILSNTTSLPSQWERTSSRSKEMTVKEPRSFNLEDNQVSLIARLDPQAPCF